jgi:reverse gyrase
MSIQDNIDNIILRDVFEEGYMNIYNRLENDIKGDTLVHATCGVGKSRFIYKTILTHFLMYDDSLVIAVFPTIALITQFNSDYISNDLGKKLFKVLSVCSRNELDKTKCKEVSFTTDPEEIYSFVNTKDKS